MNFLGRWIMNNRTGRKRRVVPAPVAMRAHHESRRLQKKRYKKILAGPVETVELRKWIEWCLYWTCHLSRQRNPKRQKIPDELDISTAQKGRGESKGGETVGFASFESQPQTERRFA